MAAVSSSLSSSSSDCSSSSSDDSASSAPVSSAEIKQRPVVVVPTPAQVAELQVFQSHIQKQMEEVKGNLADWKKKCKREKDAARKRASRARAKIEKENKALKSALEAEKKVSASLKERLEKAETELANARCGLESERKRCKILDFPTSFVWSAH
eukprot:jgi/Mesvir1/25076/Mv04604-RA.1